MIQFQKFLPRLHDIFFIALFFSILLLGSRMINLDGDLPRHLLFGRIILTERTIPATEPLIYPYENRPYVSHEWLSQVIFQAVYAISGLPGLVVLSATLLSSTFLIMYSYLVKQLSLRLPVLFIVAWGAFATSLNWAIRPHLFSMYLLAIWLVWADRVRRGEDISIWRFPLLMFLWSNLHGVFIAGILVLFAFTAGWTMDYLFSQGEKVNTGKKLWLALIFSAFASIFNPGGVGSWISILGFVNNQYLMSRMAEANPPNFQQPEMRIIFLLLIFSIFLLAIKREKLSSGQGFLLAGFSAMSLIAFRNVHLYGIVAPFVLAETLTGLRNIPIISRMETTLVGIEDGIRVAFYPILTILILGTVVITSRASKIIYQFDPQTFPVDAVNWLKLNPQTGHMFNELNWGGYLELNLQPKQKTFVDSVSDVTGEVTREYETIISLATGWEEVFNQYNIVWVILPTNSILTEKLTASDWSEVYRDETAVILRK